MAPKLKRRSVAVFYPPLQTGWWGVPGAGRGSLTHARVDPARLNGTSMAQRGPLNPSGGAICGARFSPASEFQWCAAGARRSYIECGNCLRMLAAAEEEA